LTHLTYILLIDNDRATSQDMLPALIQEGYRVDRVPPGPPALHAVVRQQPDLVILGLQPQYDEWQFCRRLLSVMDAPLFLLLCNACESDQAKALDLGASDCMVKPVFLMELLARMQAVLRRGSSTVPWRQRSYFVDGDLTVDLTRQRVQRNDRPVTLTATEFRVLTYLVCHVEEVLPQEQLVTYAWGPDYVGCSDIVKQCIHHLRRKLEPDPNHPQRIVTRRGEGYMLRRIATEKSQEV